MEQQNNQEKEKNEVGVTSLIGVIASEVVSSIAKGIFNIFKFLVDIVVYIFKSLFFVTKKAAKVPVKNLKKGVVYAGNLQSEVENAKADGKAAHFKASIKGFITYFLGNNGFVQKFSQIIIPVVCVLFFVGIINYGANINYAVSVECNGINLGTVPDEDTFNEALEIAKNRISYGDDNDNFSFISAVKYHIKAFTSKDEVLSAQLLADKIISVSGSDVTEACGIYVSDEFVGAVADGSTISSALAEKLAAYQTKGSDASDIKYSDNIEYVDGLYLTSSVYTDEEMKTKLFSKTREKQLYIAEEGDNLQLICAKYDMEESEIKELNPGLSDTESLLLGTVVYVMKTDNFLPVQYTRTISKTTYTAYKTKQVSTPTLSVGETAILVKGSRGEKQSQIKVTYIDGVETYSETLSTEVVKEPVTEQIGVGTFTAYPSDSSIVLTGTGQFMWPVNGGYISDTFMNGRVHKGIDIAANEGTEIYAADSGTVAAAGWNNGGYGYMVLIDHGNGYYTLYGHCSSLAVRTGDSVLRGQLIARVGSTGNSTGNHCHFEIRYGGMCYNPINFLNNQDESASEEKTSE